MKHLKKFNENTELNSDGKEEMINAIDNMSLDELQHAISNIGELFSKFGCVPGEDPNFDDDVQAYIVDTMRPHIRKAIADAGFGPTDKDRHSAWEK